MKVLKEIIIIPLLGIIFGFFVGSFYSFILIIENQYIQYKMFRLVAFNLQKSLNKCVILSLYLFIILWLLFFISKFIWKLFFSNVIEINIKNKNKIYIYIICLVFLFYSVWLINHYWLRHKFHTICLLCDIGILLFTIFLGLICTRIIWKNVFKPKLTEKRLKQIKIISLAIIVLLVFLNLGIFIDHTINTSSEMPNIVLISIDTLRSDHLGCYGYSRDTSPNIDEFSNRAAIFKNAITPRPKTSPSMVSILTSLYPHTHGVRENCKPLDREIFTLQEILLNENYRTAAFVGNWVLKKSPSGLNQGFEIYDDTMSDRELNRDIYERKAPDINKSVFKWLEKNYNKKFFLWIHYQDVHGPYIAPKKFQNLFKHNSHNLILEDLVPKYQRLPWVKEKFGYVDANLYKDAYDAEIKFCDEHIGNLFKKLNDLELTNLIIIITSDHGESLGEHNYYFEHGKFVYDICSKVPLLIYAPNIKSKYIDQQINIMSIAPTILSMIGYSIPEYFEGESLFSLITGKPFSSDKNIFIERKNDIKAVRTNTWKYIRNFYNDTEELYNLEKDPLEENNVIQSQYDIAKKLNNILGQWMNNNDLIYIKKLEEMKLTEETKKALKSLGYVQH